MGDFVRRDTSESFLSVHATASFLYGGYVLPESVGGTQSQIRV